jgi:hypothetical protein
MSEHYHTSQHNKSKQLNNNNQRTEKKLKGNFLCPFKIIHKEIKSSLYQKKNYYKIYKHFKITFKTIHKIIYLNLLKETKNCETSNCLDPDSDLSLLLQVWHKWRRSWSVLFVACKINSIKRELTWWRSQIQC